QPERQAIRTSAGKHEGRQVEFYNLVAAVVQIPPQAVCGAAHDKQPPKIDGVHAEVPQVFLAGFDQHVAGNPTCQLLARLIAQGRRKIEDLSTRQGTEADVEVIAVLGGKLQRHDLRVEELLDVRDGLQA